MGYRHDTVGIIFELFDYIAQEVDEGSYEAIHSDIDISSKLIKDFWLFGFYIACSDKKLTWKELNRLWKFGFACGDVELSEKEYGMVFLSNLDGSVLFGENGFMENFIKKVPYSFQLAVELDNFFFENPELHKEIFLADALLKVYENAGRYISMSDEYEDNIVKLKACSEYLKMLEKYIDEKDKLIKNTEFICKGAERELFC